MDDVIAIAAGTGTTLAKLVEYAACEAQEGLNYAKLRGVHVEMPPYMDITVTLVSGLNAFTQQNTQVNPEVTDTQTAVKGASTQTAIQTVGAQTVTSTPNGQQTVVTRSGGDRTTTDYTREGG